MEVGNVNEIMGAWSLWCEEKIKDAKSGRKEGL